MILQRLTAEKRVLGLEEYVGSDHVKINERLSIPSRELRFVATRGSGPGGQSVNKVASRVTLMFNVVSSPSLDEAQQAWVLAKLGQRISRGGVLQISSHSSRSQAANKAELRDRFAALLREALARPKRRIRTRPTRGAQEARIQSKKRRAAVKRMRGRMQSSEND